MDDTAGAQNWRDDSRATQMLWVDKVIAEMNYFYFSNASARVLHPNITALGGMRAERLR